MQNFLIRCVTNDSSVPDRTDSSGIRFYLGDKPRAHELGYLTVGADSSPLGIAIPPRADRFVIDSYCPATATAVRQIISALENDQWLIFFRNFPPRVLPLSAHFLIHISRVAPCGPRSFVMVQPCNISSMAMRMISIINLRIAFRKRSNSIRFDLIHFFDSF